MSNISTEFAKSAAGVSVPKDAAVVAYSAEQVPLILIPTHAAEVDIQEYSGRHALSIPEHDLLQIYVNIGGNVEADEASGKSDCENVVHAIRTFHEKDAVTGVGLGDLKIAIVKDPDGYELCLVSSETFDKAVANPPWIGPDELASYDVGSWEWRRAAIDAKAKQGDKGRSS